MRCRAAAARRRRAASPPSPRSRSRRRRRRSCCWGRRSSSCQAFRSSSVTASTVAILGLARVGTVRAVDELAGLAVGDPAGVVVAADDAGDSCCLASSSLSVLEGRMQEQIDGDSEDGVEVLLRLDQLTEVEATPPPVSTLAALASSDVVELVAVGGGCAAGAPGLAVEGDQADLGGGLVTAPPRIRMEPLMKGSSWSSCRKITRPLASSMRFGCSGLKACSGGMGIFFQGWACAGVQSRPTVERRRLRRRAPSVRRAQDGGFNGRREAASGAW